jgi:hypothetical protein
MQFGGIDDPDAGAASPDRGVNPNVATAASPRPARQPRRINSRRGSAPVAADRSNASSVIERSRFIPVSFLTGRGPVRQVAGSAAPASIGQRRRRCNATVRARMRRGRQGGDKGTVKWATPPRRATSGSAPECRTPCSTPSCSRPVPGADSACRDSGGGHGRGCRRPARAPPSLRAPAAWRPPKVRERVSSRQSNLVGAPTCEDAARRTIPVGAGR